MHVHVHDRDPLVRWQKIIDNQEMKLSERPYDWSEVEEIRGEGNSKTQQRPPHPLALMSKMVINRIIATMELPPNPLDTLVHQCGGQSMVAEMSGRKDFLACQDDGSFKRTKRGGNACPKREVNLMVRPPDQWFCLSRCIRYITRKNVFFCCMKSSCRMKQTKFCGRPNVHLPCILCVHGGLKRLKGFGNKCAGEGEVHARRETNRHHQRRRFHGHLSTS